MDQDKTSSWCDCQEHCTLFTDHSSHWQSRWVPARSQLNRSSRYSLQLEFHYNPVWHTLLTKNTVRYAIKTLQHNFTILYITLYHYQFHSIAAHWRAHKTAVCNMSSKSDFRPNSCSQNRHWLASLRSGSDPLDSFPTSPMHLEIDNLSF